MRVRPSLNNRLAAAAIVALCCGVLDLTRAADGTAPDGAAPAPEKATPRIDQLDLARSQAPRLTEGFIRKPETFQSMFGRQRPVFMPRASGPAPRNKTLLDEESDWSFISADDVIHDYMMREILKLPEYGPDGRDLSSLSPVERYYARVSGNKDKGRSGSVLDLFNLQPLREGEKGKDGKSPDEAAPRSDFNKLQSVSPDSAPSVVGFGRARPGSLSELLGPGRQDDPVSADAALRQAKVQQDHIEAFKKAMDYQQPALPSFTPPAPAFSPGAMPVLSAPARGVDTWNSYQVPGLSAPAAVIGQYSPALPAPTAPAAPKSSLWQPAAAVPLLPATRSPPPQKSTFAIPQRSFQ